MLQVFNAFADIDTELVSKDELLQASAISLATCCDAQQAIRDTGLLVDRDPRLRVLNRTQHNAPGRMDLTALSAFVPPHHASLLMMAEGCFRRAWTPCSAHWRASWCCRP